MCAGNALGCFMKAVSVFFFPFLCGKRMKQKQDRRAQHMHFVSPQCQRNIYIKANQTNRSHHHATPYHATSRPTQYHIVTSYAWYRCSLPVLHVPLAPPLDAATVERHPSRVQLARREPPLAIQLQRHFMERNQSEAVSNGDARDVRSRTHGVATGFKCNIQRRGGLIHQCIGRSAHRT